MNIEDLLSILTADQLEQLAVLKREESEDQPKPKPKRKQNRNKKTTNKNLGRSTRPRKKKQTSSSSQHSGIPTKGTPSRKTELLLGNRANNFETSEDFDGHKDDIAIDKILFNKISKRNRQPTPVIDAKCSKCDCLYENVLSTNCYKDENIYVFICEECIGGSR